MGYYDKIRAVRMKAAREKGNHTEEEWQAMIVFFRHHCVKCCQKITGSVCKDHIVPIYQGGSNHIRNLQPLCWGCNSSKGPDTIDYRELLAYELRLVLPAEYTNAY